jgi:hypothetical protein
MGQGLVREEGVEDTMFGCADTGLSRLHRVDGAWVCSVEACEAFVATRLGSQRRHN